MIPTKKDMHLVKDYDQIPNPRCDQCEFYYMIDSVYGKCRRFPPQWLSRFQWRTRWWPWWKLFGRVPDVKYPEVTWCGFPCHEFKRKATT